MNTNPIESAFWQLLRAGLWQEARFLQPKPQLSDSQWQEVYSLALRTGTVGIVAEGLELLPQRPPQAVLLDFVAQRGELIRRHLKHNQVIGDLMRTFRSLGVDSLLLKGQGCAYQYAKPYCRSCGDIDIYIGPERIDSMLVELEKLGITCEEEIDDNMKHAKFYHNGLTIELHRYPCRLNGRRINSSFQKWWHGAMLEGERLHITSQGLASKAAEGSELVRLAPPEQNVFFLFYHAFVHYTNSTLVQFRQFCDIARFLHTHRASLDREQLGLRLREFRLMHAWQLFGAYLHQYLGLEADSIPFFNPSLSAEPVAERLRRKCLYPQPPRWRRPKNRLGSKAYTVVYDFVSTFELLGSLPREACSMLVHNLLRGVPNFFNRRNRSGTHEHYQERMRRNA